MSDEEENVDIPEFPVARPPTPPRRGGFRRIRNRPRLRPRAPGLIRPMLEFRFEEEFENPADFDDLGFEDEGPFPLGLPGVVFSNFIADLLHNQFRDMMELNEEAIEEVQRATELFARSLLIDLSIIGRQANRAAIDRNDVLDALDVYNRRF